MRVRFRPRIGPFTITTEPARPRPPITRGQAVLIYAALAVFGVAFAFCLHGTTWWPR